MQYVGDTLYKPSTLTHRNSYDDATKSAMNTLPNASITTVQDLNVQIKQCAKSLTSVPNP